MKTRSTKYKADLAEKLAKMQRSRDNPKISRLLDKLVEEGNKNPGVYSDVGWSAY